MPAYIGESIRISVDEQRLCWSVATFNQSQLLLEVIREVRGRSSELIEAPDNLNSLDPICIENAFSWGNRDCPFRIKRSPVRITPGVLMGPFPLDIEDAPESGIFPPTFSAVKFSKSHRDCPDTLETIEPPCTSSPTHMSCARLSTANIIGETTRKPTSSSFRSSR